MMPSSSNPSAPSDVWDGIWSPAIVATPPSKKATVKVKKMGKKDWLQALIKAVQSENSAALEEHLAHPGFTLDSSGFQKIWTELTIDKKILNVVASLPTTVTDFTVDDLFDLILKHAAKNPSKSGEMTATVLEIFSKNWSLADHKEAMISAAAIETSAISLSAQLAVIDNIKNSKPSTLPGILKDVSDEIVDGVDMLMVSDLPQFAHTPAGRSVFHAWCASVLPHCSVSDQQKVLQLFLIPQEQTFSQTPSMTGEDIRRPQNQRSEMSYNDCIMVHQMMSAVPALTAPMTQAVRSFDVSAKIHKENCPKLFPLLTSWTNDQTVSSQPPALSSKNKLSPSVSLSCSPRTLQELLWASAAPAIFQMAANPSDLPVLQRLVTGSSSATVLLGLNIHRALLKRQPGVSLSALLTAVPDLVAWRDPAGNTLGHWIIAGLAASAHGNKAADLQALAKTSKPVLEALLPTISSKAPEWLISKNALGHSLFDVLSTHPAWLASPLSATRAQWSKKELSLTTKDTTARKPKVPSRRM